jgi:hypothetical protein
MIIGEKIVESETVFCTWHGIKNTNVYCDASANVYGITQNGIVLVIKNTLSEICLSYIDITWRKE